MAIDDRPWSILGDRSPMPRVYTGSCSGESIAVSRVVRLIKKSVVLLFKVKVLMAGVFVSVEYSQLCTTNMKGRTLNQPPHRLPKLGHSYR